MPGVPLEVCKTAKPTLAHSVAQHSTRLTKNLRATLRTRYPHANIDINTGAAATAHMTRRGQAEEAPPHHIAALRVSALDADRLDVELTDMLRLQFTSILALFQPGVVTALQPELTVLLDFLIFRFSVWRGRPTPGSTLMNLRFRSNHSRLPDKHSAAAPAEPLGGRTGVEGQPLSASQRVGYGLATVGARYLWTRLSLLASAQHWGDAPADSWMSTGWRVLRRIETAFRLAMVVNLFIFLHRGTYRSLVHRMLGAQLVYEKAVMSRALSFEYLNSQLVWHELSELLLFVLPLVDVTRLKRLLHTHMPALAATASAGDRGSSNQEAASSACTACGVNPQLLPYEALPCRHRYCYYCLRSRTHADPAFSCLRCQTRVVAIRPLR